MKTILHTKELYALFLDSDFWRQLASQARKAAGNKCQRCGVTGVILQAHHKFYRENWFDTQLSDLECLCRDCHRKEHGLVKSELQRLYELKAQKKAQLQGFKKRFRKTRRRHRRRKRIKELRWWPGMYEGLAPGQARDQIGRQLT